MATSTRRRRKAPSVRRVTSVAERKRPGFFKRLKKDETFRGVALFEPDPELKENPGFFEYYDHWDQQGNAFVPCVGDGCIFCAAGQNPSTRAMTLWYFPDEDNKERFKIFTANFRLIDDFADISEEEDGGLMGLKIRVRRKDDQGTYSARPLTDKRLSQAQLKKLIAEGIETVGDFEEIMDRNLQRQLERLKAVEALEEDDDDYDEDEDEEEEEKPRRSRTRAKSRDDDEDEDEEEEEDEDEDESEEDEEEEDESDDEADEDEEEDDDEEAEEEEAEDGDAELEGVTLTVSSVDRENEEIKVKDAKGNSFVLFLEADLEVDFDEIKRGGKLKVDAVRDDEDDMVATSISVIKQRSRSRSTSNAKKPATRRAAKTTTTRSRSRSK